MATEKVAAAIAAGVANLGQQLPAGAGEQLLHLIFELERWNRRINLTAIRQPADMVPGHILDSLSVRPLLNGTSVLDIGTGAGFPGLPLAIADPSREFVLLDSNGRKISFVEYMIGELGLVNVVAVRTRAEDYAPGRRFDTVIARALATLPRLLEIAGHLVGDGGEMLALKGRNPAAELEMLKPGWEYDVIDVTVPGLDAHARHVVSLTRAGNT